MAVLVPYLLKQNPQFRNHTLRVYTVGKHVKSDDTYHAGRRTENLTKLLTKLRIESVSQSFKLDLKATSEGAIEAFEKANRNRSTVLNRIRQRRS